MEKKFYRVRQGKIIAGVCGGIEKYFGIGPKIVRLLCVALIAAYVKFIKNVNYLEGNHFYNQLFASRVEMNSNQ